MSDTFDHEADAWDSLHSWSADEPYEIRRPQCNRCGSKNVIWLTKNRKWVLSDNVTGNMHICKGDIRSMPNLDA